ncbi:MULTISPECIES: CinA family protein [unclassified Alteromonas]|uniref:CinA family protein n=1 Tax=unclassified Alteromonas TaxID=2614992 RepID=UPI00192163F1|nr:MULTISPECIES: CinA family protein [unclassified Alteromonas]WDT87034.1 CinA family protein [Alteromonas sp. 009811495]BCO18029.1 competence damage-inducible protein A [Alteromonas sp. KC3]BCO21990.1 competence damage-inducible protein A [Alteromonas sp. KC14]
MNSTFSTESNANASPLQLDSALTAQVLALGDVLREKKWTVSTAESCTGGGVAFAFTSVAGSSDWFNQSWVTYSNEAKQRELGVTLQTLEQYGAVSEQTVKEMALGVCGKSGAQLAVTVSGIAGPGGGSDEKPVGTVWFGFVCGDSTAQIKQVFSGDRDQVRSAAISFAITHLIKMLSEK